MRSIPLHFFLTFLYKKMASDSYWSWARIIDMLMATAIVSAGVVSAALYTQKPYLHGEILRLKLELCEERAQREVMDLTRKLEQFTAHHSPEDQSVPDTDKNTPNDLIPSGSHVDVQWMK